MCSKLHPSCTQAAPTSLENRSSYIIYATLLATTKNATLVRHYFYHYDPVVHRTRVVSKAKGQHSLIDVPMVSATIHFVEQLNIYIYFLPHSSARSPSCARLAVVTIEPSRVRVHPMPCHVLFVSLLDMAEWFIPCMSGYLIICIPRSLPAYSIDSTGIDANVFAFFFFFVFVFVFFVQEEDGRAFLLLHIQ